VNIFQIENRLHDQIESMLLAQQEGIPEGAAIDQLLYIFECLEGDLQDKIESYCHVVNRRAALIQAREDEVCRLQKLIRADLNHVARMKETVKEVLNRLGMARIETKSFKVRVQTNGGKAPLKFDENYQIPDEFCRIKKEPDTDKIREAIESGEVLEFVEMLPRGNHLQIK
jgi:hypothetical protein